MRPRGRLIIGPELGNELGSRGPAGFQRRSVGDAAFLSSVQRPSARPASFLGSAPISLQTAPRPVSSSLPRLQCGQVAWEGGSRKWCRADEPLTPGLPLQGAAAGPGRPEGGCGESSGMDFG